MKQFAVLGLGRFGMSILKRLSEMGQETAGVDRNHARVQVASAWATHAVEGDCTDEDLLRTLGIRNFDVVVVGIGELEPSLVATALVKEMGGPRVVAKASSHLHGKLLERIGCDQVVFPERDMGVRLARNLGSPKVLDFLQLAPHFELLEMTPTEGMVGKSLRELAFRERYGVNVVALKKADRMNLSPGPDDRIEASDILVVVGRSEALTALGQDR